jgi:antitoxin component YwqK of YwqJK toxin-antitoxin module
MKKTLLIITAFLFITSTVFTQSKVNVNSLKEYGGKAFKVDDDEPYTGRVFDLNKSTGKKTLKGQYKNGLKTGKWTEWYSNGQKWLEGTYKNGERDGLWTEWFYENGQKWSEKKYKDGVPDGIHTWWYSNGQKNSEGTFKDGEKDGKWTYWSGGEAGGEVIFQPYHKSFETTFKDGELISSKCWDEDGDECECNSWGTGCN